MKVLIVDDSDIAREAIKEYLVSEGHEVIGMAEDGFTALGELEKARPDIVTVDITMPGLDGIAALKEMLKMQPHLKIIVISAVVDKKVTLEALRSGARYFLPKPFTKESLLKALKHLVE